MAIGPMHLVSESEGIQIGRIAGISENDEGAFVAIDISLQRLLRFNADGELLRTIGRPGDGPGEFRLLMRVAVGGDSVWTWDHAQRRLSHFLLSGQLARDTVMKALNPVAAMMWAKGVGLVLQVGPAWSSPPTPSQGLARLQTLDEHRTVEWSEEKSTVADVRPGSSSVAAVPFGASRKWILTTGGMLMMTEGAVYRVTQYNDRWVAARAFTRTYQPIPVTELERDSALQNLDPPLRRRAVIPRSKPAIEQLLRGPDGEVWIRVNERGADPHLHRWDLLGPSGTLRGFVRLPAEMSVRCVTRRFLVGVVSDSTGAEHIALIERLSGST